MLAALSSTTIASEKLQLVLDILHFTTQWKKTELAISVIKGLLHACGTCTNTSTFLYSEYVLLHLISYIRLFLVPYSGKLSREKIFANFAVLWLFVTVFLHEIWGCGILWHGKVSNPRKFSPQKNVLFTNLRKFSPSKVSHYTVHGLHYNCILCKKDYLQCTFLCLWTSFLLYHRENLSHTVSRIGIHYR